MTNPVATTSPGSTSMLGTEGWLVLLRIVVGAWFLKAVWTKLTVEFAAGVVPYITVSSRFIGFHPKRVAEFAAGNPVGWYKDFLENTILPNATLFAKLQTYGEVAVGVGLIVGFCIGLTALVGLFLTVNYGLATQWMSFGQQGFHLMLVTSMIILLGARAGRLWGIDGLILRAAPPTRRRWLKVIMVLAVCLILPAVSGLAAAELRVFVTNEKSNNVTVIQAQNQKVLATIPVGERPRGIAVSRDGRRVFVANSNSNNVSVIDAKSLQVVDTLPAGLDPEGMTLDQDDRLYIVNENDSAVTIVDVSKREIVKRLEVGTEPETAVLSPDGRWVSVSNETSNEVHLFDTASVTIVGKVPVPRNPRGMRFTADSRQLYVASEQAHVISIVDVEKRALMKSIPTSGERPVDIVISLDGASLYVSHGASGDVRVFEAASLKRVATIPVGPRAWWMALTPDGRFLYVTVGRANEVVVIDTRSNTVAARIAAGELPWGVALAEVD
jgi:PQQ-dependent catabolism-associated beta-propeller protein